jgi:hypothetical protein
MLLLSQVVNLSVKAKAKVAQDLINDTPVLKTYGGVEAYVITDLRTRWDKWPVS